MNIIFFGTPQFSVPTLEALDKDPEITVKAVITQPDKPVGRKQTMQKPAVKTCAEKLGITVLQPNNKKELSLLLKNQHADFFVVIAYGMIMEKGVLEIPKYGAINSHASILPKYRGASPIQQSLLNDDPETGVSFMKMDHKMDHGPVFHIEKLKINDNDDLLSLSIKLSQLSANKMPSILKMIKNKELTSKIQDHNEATYCKKIQRSDGEINFNNTAREIFKQEKAFTPWPGLFTKLNGKKIKIKDIEIINKEQQQQPGFQILENELVINTGKGVIRPGKIQIEGKRELENKEFLNGHISLFKEESS